MKVILTIIILVIFFSLTSVGANLLLDQDQDGVPDQDELNIYFTNVSDKDTKKDGYSDFIELTFGFSPHNPEPIKLEDNDQDNDGLSDRMELNFHTNIIDPDTDQDGFQDGEEIANSYDPLNKDKVKLNKRIEINIGAQELNYFLKDVRMGTTIISSGINNSTPKGIFEITNKHPKAWSPYGLWMPYWNGLNDGKIGIHELPVWPSGYTEGEDHLGTPVSHGCVRVGHEAAAFLYDWAPIGPEVFIY
ncbi:L,D-transpeptidase [Candidatus Parcubacteria bacterium]|nr:L,D-transpeptidase [Candidatus Parcubacteria bacterium]